MTYTRWIWIVLAGTACGSPMTALRTENNHLEQQVAELRADRRAKDRKLADLEHQLALAKDKAAAVDVPPSLPVEVVAPPTAAVMPDGGRVVGTTDDGGEIVYEGDAATGKAATLDDDTPPRHVARIAPPPPPSDDTPVAADRIEVTHRVPVPRVSDSPAPSSGVAVAARAPRAHVRDGAGDPGTDYRAAVDLVKSGSYVDAIAALRAFVQHYPRHDYADNAQYWIGEAFYAQKDYPHALAEFRATIETYPRGNKVPDALLKVGYCYAALGQADKARAVLEQVVSLYPKSEPAALAAKRLENP
ncbi:MAG TPA: tol-pal system protein YbgF [Kofleriaceae bacterium]|nr:tol-pal system protein YbgF [Kofleriaceae bacterium]